MKRWLTFSVIREIQIRAAHLLYSLNSHAGETEYGEDAEQLKCSRAVGGNAKWCNNHGIQVGGSS